MVRAISLSLILLLLPGCDCQKGKTGPAAAFDYLVVQGGSSDLDEISWKRFEAGLRLQSYRDLRRTLEPLDNFYDEPDKIAGTIKKAADLVIDEVLSRNPSWRDVHRFLGDDYFGGLKSELLFPALANQHPERGWKLINSYYRAAYRYDPDMGMSSEHAWLFFRGLQRHHPALAWNYLKELLIEFSCESSALRIGGAGGMMSAMTTPEEALSLLFALREDKLGETPMGFFGLRRDFLKIDPVDLDLCRMNTNALLTLARLSPEKAAEWILENKKNEILPKQWAVSYLIGVVRHADQETGSKNSESNINDALGFITQHLEPGDGNLVSSYFYVPEKFRSKFLEASKESSR